MPPLALTGRRSIGVPDRVGWVTQVVLTVWAEAGASGSSFSGGIAPPGVAPPVERCTISSLAALAVPIPPMLTSMIAALRLAAVTRVIVSSVVLSATLLRVTENLAIFVILRKFSYMLVLNVQVIMDRAVIIQPGDKVDISHVVACALDETLKRIAKSLVEFLGGDRESFAIFHCLSHGSILSNQQSHVNRIVVICLGYRDLDLVMDHHWGELTRHCNP